MRLIPAMSLASRLVGSTRSRYVHAACAALAVLCTVGATAAPARSRPARGTAVAAPAIYGVSVSPGVAHAGDAVTWDAAVSPSVVSVTARVAVYSFSLSPTRRGHFGQVFYIPKDVPPFFHGNYGITFTAHAANGATASTYRSMAFR